MLRSELRRLRRARPLTRPGHARGRFTAAALACAFLASPVRAFGEEPPDSAPPSPPAPQASPARNGLYVEGLGNGVLYSFNYERFVLDDLAVRVGFGMASISQLTVTWVPVTVSYLTNREGGYALELGGGALVGHSSGHLDFGFSDAPPPDTQSTGVYATGIVGLRYERRPGGFLFRVGFTPVFGLSSGRFFLLPWGGFSLGIGF
jgi:hypothetical protein